MAQKKKNKKTPNNVPSVPSLPKVEKELKDFMADDQGKMTRKDVAKLGVSLAVLGMMMQPETASAQYSHSNTAVATGGTCVSHTNVSTHSNHSNHSEGGWMC